MVLFLGGSCLNPKRCSWYCPISSSRKNKNQVYADEIAVRKLDDVIDEIYKIQAKGCSFTGGDPLRDEDSLKKTIYYLKNIKKEFPNDFHTHLYTCGTNFTPKTGEKLAKAGLNEIRFHPAEENFHKIQYAMDLGMTVGAEIPVIPGPEYKEYILNLIDYLDNIGADFLNLNEFEMNEPNAAELKKRNFHLKDNSLASVVGSEELALTILEELPSRYILSVHYCPVSLKDGIQVRNRYKRRAEMIQKPFEEISKDGTLIFLRLEGKKSILIEIQAHLINKNKLPEYMMELNLTGSPYHLDLPYFMVENRSFKLFLKNYDLKAGIMEILPFRGDYFELCEYIPVDNKD
jgi:pyruvate formate-lyase activating enzyme-like uncharacterized protein